MSAAIVCGAGVAVPHLIGRRVLTGAPPVIWVPPTTEK